MIDYSERFPVKVLYENDSYVLRAGIIAMGFGGRVTTEYRLRIEEFKKDQHNDWKVSGSGPFNYHQIICIKQVIDSYLDAYHADKLQEL